MRGGPVGSLLVEAVRGDAWRSPSPPVARLAPLVDRADFALAAEYHGVPAYHRSLLHHLRALSDLTVVDAALRSVGAPYVVARATRLRPHQLAASPKCLSAQTIGPLPCAPSTIACAMSHSLRCPLWEQCPARRTR